MYNGMFLMGEHEGFLRKKFIIFCNLPVGTKNFG